MPAWSDFDTGLSILANGIAVATFVFGITPVVRWATAIRRGVASQQFHLPDEPPLTPVSYPYCQIRMVALEGPGPNDWRIRWTEIGGMDQQGVATIRSPRLRGHLLRHRKHRDFHIVGEVSYLRAHNGEVRFIEITGLSYICGDWFSANVIGAWSRMTRRSV
jgi:hypothetical protein